MKAYKVKQSKLPGSKYKRVRKLAMRYYRTLKARSRRRSYVRSAYFNKEKVFLDLFWSHTFEKKNFWDQMRRMKFFPCGIELIKHNTYQPITKENPNKQGELLHRFAGLTADNELFFVQVKEDKKTGKKYLISVFPIEK